MHKNKDFGILLLLPLPIAKFYKNLVNPEGP